MQALPPCDFTKSLLLWQVALIHLLSRANITYWTSVVTGNLFYADGFSCHLFIICMKFCCRAIKNVTCFCFRWTGSNTNPHNNDGQGRAGTDRSNVVLQRVQAYEEGTGLAYKSTTKHGHWGRSYPELIKNATLMGFSEKDLLDLASLRSREYMYIQ